MIEKLNVNEFLLKEFKGSLEAWIIDLKLLKFKKIIASGSTCQVYSGSYMNIPVAIKKLTAKKKKLDISGITNSSSKFLKEFKREIGLLVSLPNHPNLLTLLGFSFHEDEIYIVTEFCQSGTLFDLLYKEKTKIKMSFRQQLKILMDICRGMQFLHVLKKQIIHRDLKSLNIFVDNRIKGGNLEFQTKIADFGLARSLDGPSEFITQRMGTFHWMAPEIFDGGPYSTKTDVYAFAIIMWEIFSQKTPYYDLRKTEHIYKHVFYDNKRPGFHDCKLPPRYQNRLENIMAENWHRNPSTRKEFSEIYIQLNEIWDKLPN